jgi:hypothetical protein
VICVVFRGCRDGVGQHRRGPVEGELCDEGQLGLGAHGEIAQNQTGGELLFVLILLFLVALFFAFGLLIFLAVELVGQVAAVVGEDKALHAFDPLLRAVAQVQQRQPLLGLVLSFFAFPFFRRQALLQRRHDDRRHPAAVARDLGFRAALDVVFGGTAGGSRHDLAVTAVGVQGIGDPAPVPGDHRVFDLAKLHEVGGGQRSVPGQSGGAEGRGARASQKDRAKESLPAEHGEGVLRVKGSDKATTDLGRRRSTISERHI